MSTFTTNLKTKKGLVKAIEAYCIVSDFSNSELETLEILSNQKEEDLILRSLEESRNNKVYLLRSIL